MRRWLVIFLAAAGCASAKQVTVTTNPAGADVSVDGKPVGKSPTTFTDVPGDGTHYYKVNLALPGYKPKEVVLKQEQSKGSTACIGFAAGCCPLFQVCLLKAYTLPKPEYVWDLEPLGAPALTSPTAPPPGYLPPAPPPAAGSSSTAPPGYLAPDGK